MSRVGTYLRIAVLVLAARCGPPSGLPSRLAQVHSQSGWVDPSAAGFHGAILRLRDYNYSACLSCHVEADCWDCHADYPKSDEFHGDKISSKADLQNRCAPCHGADFKGGRSGVSCTTHHNYPHPQDYESAHRLDIRAGVATIEDFLRNPDPQKYPGPNACLKCHADDDKLERGFKPGCQKCHAGGSRGFTRHAPAAALMADHPAQYGERGAVPCAPCHAPAQESSALKRTLYFDSNGRPSFPSLCIECHTSPDLMHWGIPDWGPPKPDGNISGAHPNFLFSRRCTPCHGSYPGFGGKTRSETIIIRGCASCHAGFYGRFPHTDPQATHKEYLASESREQCFACHRLETDRPETDQYTNRPVVIPACVKCHPQNHLETGWEDAHRRHLMDNYYSAEEWALDLSATGANCESCHFDEGKNWSTCARCHAPYPVQHVTYNPDWMTPGNPLSHGMIYGASYRTACATACHGEDLTGGSSGVACSICHVLP